jgi:molybdenum cofactor cytidylyltransferase
MHLPGIVILAAGSSTRLGQPKQLLEFQGTTLVQRITQIAVDAVKEPVVVILGANCNLIHSRLTHLPVHMVYNPDWSRGMTSSIRKGLLALLYFSPDTDSAIFAVCDQPYITPDLFLEMISVGSKSQKPIVACLYNNVLGTPVLFKKEYFDVLLTLKDNEGARKIIQSHPESAEAVPFPLGIYDVDTMQDYEALQNKMM